MPINYKNDTEYKNEEEEIQDIRDATLAKTLSMNNDNIMDFDDFLVKEGITNVVYNKNSK